MFRVSSPFAHARNVSHEGCRGYCNSTTLTPTLWHYWHLYRIIGEKKLFKRWHLALQTDPHNHGHRRATKSKNIQNQKGIENQKKRSLIGFIKLITLFSKTKVNTNIENLYKMTTMGKLFRLMSIVVALLCCTFVSAAPVRSHRHIEHGGVDWSGFMDSVKSMFSPRETFIGYPKVTALPTVTTVQTVTSFPTVATIKPVTPSPCPTFVLYDHIHPSVAPVPMEDKDDGEYSLAAKVRFDDSGNMIRPTPAVTLSWRHSFDKAVRKFLNIPETVDEVADVSLTKNADSMVDGDKLEKMEDGSVILEDENTPEFIEDDGIALGPNDDEMENAEFNEDPDFAEDFAEVEFDPAVFDEDVHAGDAPNAFDDGFEKEDFEQTLDDGESNLMLETDDEALFDQAIDAEQLATEEMVDEKIPSVELPKDNLDNEVSMNDEEPMSDANEIVDDVGTQDGEEVAADDGDSDAAVANENSGAEHFTAEDFTTEDLTVDKSALEDVTTSDSSTRGDVAADGASVTAGKSILEGTTAGDSPTRDNVAADGASFTADKSTPKDMISRDISTGEATSDGASLTADGASLTTDGASLTTGGASLTADKSTPKDMIGSDFSAGEATSDGASLTADKSTPKDVIGSDSSADDASLSDTTAAME